MKHKTFLTRIALPSLMLALGILFANTRQQAQAQAPQIKTAVSINTAFTYQGRLTDSGDAADGVYDFQFKLHDAETGGGQVGSPAASDDIAVAGGLFTVQLDFGDVFDGTALWMEIAVRLGNSSGVYTTLSPRQPLTATPYALRARLADNSLGTLSCTTDQIAKFNGTNWVCADDQSAALEARVVALENLLTHVSRDGDDIFITGANLHVVNGQNDTETSNGLGNVIIGYNEERASGTNDRSGSHTLAVGSENNYSSYGGIVIGKNNTVNGIYASVSGGTGNKATGAYASVSGGEVNTANGDYASISAGSFNLASGAWTSVSGGNFNTASDTYASVSGGELNTASGSAASVSSGIDNTADGEAASVSGGTGNNATGFNASVSGGYFNTANNEYTSISGGAFNLASGSAASVSGGNSNTASGTAASASGGNLNTASGLRASVSGGDDNLAIGDYTAVSGGFSNIASGPRASVSGGANNVAGASKSSVSGGSNRSVFGTFDWRAGGLFETE